MYRYAEYAANGVRLGNTNVLCGDKNRGLALKHLCLHKRRKKQKHLMESESLLSKRENQ